MRWHRHYAVCSKRSLIALQASQCGAGFRSANMGYAATALLDQVLGPHLTHMLIVNSDEIRRKANKSAVDQNIGDSSLLDRAKALNRPLSRCDYNCIDAAREQLLNLLLLQFRVLLRRSDDEAVALPA